MSEPKDFYAVLGIPRSATPAEIKKAYRRLARKHHPDVNAGSKAAEERFKEVNAAFEVLGDPERRKLYDELGHDAAKLGWDPKRAAEYRRYRDTARASHGRSARGDFGGGFDDILESMFGRPTSRRGERVFDFDFGFGGPEGGGRPRGRPPTGVDLTATAEVSLADAVRGAAVEIVVGKPGGHAPTRLTVKVPAGIADGERIRLAGQGAASRRGGAHGDLYIDVHVKVHPLVRRDGADLYLPLPVTVTEAVRGATVSLPTFDGPVKLKVPPGSQSGQTLRLRDRGVPRLHGEGRGDLYAEIRIMVPTGAAADAAAGALEPLYPDDVRKGLVL